ncbi:unnamed protein product [Allacma fusca]|uniref:Uncharacterized protein n=1 Tax=Allacma fusca TaxID=39272 RepID=A0A8J2LQ04_9HEXA|nr:unnamed protein product [Allacma fusca]
MYSEVILTSNGLDSFGVIVLLYWINSWSEPRRLRLRIIRLTQHGNIAQAEPEPEVLQYEYSCAMPSRWWERGKYIVVVWISELGLV